MCVFWTALAEQLWCKGKFNTYVILINIHQIYERIWERYAISHWQFSNKMTQGRIEYSHSHVPRGQRIAKLRPHIYSWSVCGWVLLCWQKWRHSWPVWPWWVTGRRSRVSPGSFVISLTANYHHANHLRPHEPNSNISEVIPRPGNQLTCRPGWQNKKIKCNLLTY